MTLTRVTARIYAADFRATYTVHLLYASLERMPSIARTFKVPFRIYLALVIASVLLSPPMVAPSADAPSFPVQIDRTGVVTPADRGHTIEDAFDVPPGTRQIDIDFDYERDEFDRPSQFDVGLRSPEGLRGWSEDHRAHIHIDATSASYGYLPGPTSPGNWSVLVGVANVPDRTRYHMSIRLSSDLSSPHVTLQSQPGWYAGDLHTHSGHSDGRIASSNTPVSVEDLAAAAAARGLDFIAVTDHNTSSHWIDVDRVQAATRRVLLLHGREITTYHGHFNAIGERRVSAFALDLSRPIRDLMTAASSDGSFVSINHAWLADDEWCPGCRWIARDRQTIAAARGIEVANGPTVDDLPGWDLWARLLNAGQWLVPVGGSDIHDLTGGDRRIGEPTTIVYANGLSEDDIVTGLKSGRVYGRTDGPDGPALDFRAEGAHDEFALMGQSIVPGHLHLLATIDRAEGQECEWLNRASTITTQPIQSDHATLTTDIDAQLGDWISLRLRRGPHVTAWSNAIYVGNAVR